MQHIVLITAAGRRYAIPSSHVVEVIPVVNVQPLPQAPTWVYGTMNYRGRLIVTLDFSALVGGPKCPLRMVNRIVVVRTDRDPVESAAMTGLLVEAVLGSEPMEFDEASGHAQLSPPELGFLQRTLLADSQTLQLVDTTQLPRPFADTPIAPTRETGG